MTALEALFNTGRSELRYRIARSAAVLLGTDVVRSRRIFRDVRDAYDFRSKVRHTGDTSGVEKLFLWSLSRHVTDAVQTCWHLDLEKKVLADSLSESAFGDFRITVSLDDRDA